ncbi:UNVERIFIED_CONTAM: hypothetical protein PYX00_000625 [Menopon gallinae]|uniref:PH domain-containing protein n=1 Tax=Menopon gallinae TaxID=328185 RepID=A0AAW2IB29_9NEOP
MKFNCKELAEYSNGEATIEGRLHHKRITGGFSQSGKDTWHAARFKEKWFKLRANVLFYFSATEQGKVFDKRPSGAFVLENAVVQYEMNSEVPFSFSILFHDDVEKKHLFAGRSEENIDQWVNFLKQASYEFWRSQLIMLQTKICMLTGKVSFLGDNTENYHCFDFWDEFLYIPEYIKLMLLIIIRLVSLG